jgi:hypothetical protein
LPARRALPGIIGAITIVTGTITRTPKFNWTPEAPRGIDYGRSGLACVEQLHAYGVLLQ